MSGKSRLLGIARCKNASEVMVQLSMLLHPDKREDTTSNGSNYVKNKSNEQSKSVSMEDFADMADCLSSSEHQELMQSITSSCQLAVDNLFELDIIDQDNHKEISRLILYLLDMTKIASIYVDRFKTISIIPLAQPLHDILIPLDSFESIPKVMDLKVGISRLCEAIYLSNCEGSESLVTQLLPHLILVSLTPAAPDADIKRVYAIKSALDLFDFEDESIESLRGLLLRCFIQPCYLRLNEGKKFLAHVFNIEANYPSMVGVTSMQELILDVIKPQIANASRLVCSAYGDVLVKAWKQSDNKALIEEHLQVLANDAIHSSDRSQFKGLRLVLSAFNELKREKDVDAMLNRLYGPFIWRSLKCANAIIRSQSAVLFFDVFPLQDPELGAAAAENHLQFQFETLTALLQDGDHRVRAVAATGSCTILREYWEAMPLQETKKILTYLVNTLSTDASCASVRHGVVQGLAILLDQPLSHHVLKKLLPHLSNVIHDHSEKVRHSFVELLAKVKGIRGMHFYDIVPVAHVLERMAEDSDRPKIQHAITDLLLNSFYPQDESGESMGALRLQRCLSFIQENIVAAEAFYAALHQHVSVGASTKMCVILFSLFISRAPTSDEEQITISDEYDENAMNKTNKRESRDGKRSNKITQKTLNRSQPAFSDMISDPTVRMGVLRVLFSCLKSIQEKLCQSKYSSSYDLLRNHFTMSNMRHIVSIYKAYDGTHSNGLNGNNNTDEFSVVLKILSIVEAIYHSVEAPKGENENQTKKGKKQSKGSKDLAVYSSEILSVEDILLDIKAMYESQTSSQQSTATSSSNHSDEDSHERFLLSRKLRVQSTLDFALSVGFLMPVLDNMNQSLVAALDKSSSKTKTSSQLAFPLTMILDAVEVVVRYVNDDDKTDSIVEVSNHVRQLFQHLGEIFLRQFKSKTSMESNAKIIEKFTLMWASFAIGCSSQRSVQEFHEFAHWCDEILPAAVAGNHSLRILLAILIVCSDTIFSHALNEDIQTNLACWIEALSHVLQNNIDVIPSTLHESSMQVSMRLALALGSKGRDMEISGQFDMIKSLLDTITYCCKRCSEDRRMHLTKGLKMLSNKLAERSSKEDSADCESLLNHAIFVE